jgi:hypothetical protein
MQFSKVSTKAGRSEGFFLRSENMLETTISPSDITFDLVPHGEFGFRATNGTVAEEGGVVQLSGGGFYAVYRTLSGFLNVATSGDGIDWKDAQYAWYDVADYGKNMYEQRVKQPRGHGARFSDRDILSRMPLVPTPARLTQAGVRPVAFLSGVRSSYRCNHKSYPNTEDR